jgi:hypothetical protein
VNPLVTPYTLGAVGPGGPALLPLLPLRLSHLGRTVTVDGLVDSGSSVNVLPFAVGQQLGLDWSNSPDGGPLGGALSAVDTRAVRLVAEIGPFPRVRLAFLWASAALPRIILGQFNFFLEFDVCFFATRGQFTVAPRTP